MLVSIFQFDVAWHDPAKNLSKIEEVCALLAGNTNLLVLPEMFNTGYEMMPQHLETKWQDETILQLSNLSAEYDMIIAGSIPMYKDGQFFNTFIAVNALGVFAKYDKIHLFSLAGEAKNYEAGINRIKFDMNDFSIQPLICYDLRFPYISTNKQPIDLIIYSANWPKTRVSHWRSLLIARAIENQCYVIGVNRTGEDNNGYHYPGASMIVDYNGEIIVEMEDSPAFITYNLDKPKMMAYREKLPFMMDRKWDLI
jgi:omega-amidase